MGEIRKQSFYSSIYTYIGFGIGALNTLVLLIPKWGVFTLEEIGLTRILIDFGALFSVLAVMGATTTFIKFYPFHRSSLKPKDNDLPFITMVVCLIGSMILVAGLLLFEDFFARKFGRNSALFISHFKLVIPFTLSVIVFNLFEAFAWSVQKTIASNFSKEVIVRLATLTVIVLYYTKLIDIDTFFILFSLIYVPAFLYVGYILFRENSIRICTKISGVTKKLKRQIFVFNAYHFAGGLFSQLPKTIDVLIIGSVLEGGLGKAGIYAIPTYLVTVMEVPQRSMLGIGSATISQAWRDNDLKRIASVYKKSSINLITFGFLLFGLLYPNIDNLIRFLGEEYASIKNVFLILGMAKLIDLLMGLNNLIMGFSDKWKIDFYTNVVFILISVIFTYTLSVRFDLIGTAIGSALTMIGYNCMRLFYIWKLFGLLPFSKKTIQVIVVGAITVTLTFLLPYIGNYFLDAAVRVIVFLLLFIPPVLLLKISPDINDIYQKALKIILRKK